MGDEHKGLNHVVIVDDDPILCAIAESHFKKSGCRRIDCASNGEQGLAILDQCAEDPDLLLVDLNMPYMDGVQFLRHLGQRQFSGAILIVSGEPKSVIALSARIAKTHDLKIVGSLSKPLQIEQLKELTAMACGEATAAPAPAGNSFTVADLRAAISGGQIVSYYQPKIDVPSGRTVGVEALARWQHPELGMIGPVNFIPMAEEHDLISGLTAVMLRAAILDVRRWVGMGLQLSCSVNLSATTLDNINFPDAISACVDAAGLEKSKFIFEVTESSLVRREAVPMEVLARLRLAGFDLAIDDFGTGSSNIEHLRDFPFSELKIDRSFVSEMHKEAFARQCVLASIELGHELGLRIVAEGVEEEDEAATLAGLGVDQIQGYLYGKPMSAEAFPQWLKGYGGIRSKASAEAPKLRRTAVRA